MKTLKLMPDYFCFPLWEVSPNWGNINPDDLPLSNELKSDLLYWAKLYDETLDQDDPTSSGFENIQKKTEFKEKGIDLARRLRDEIGDVYIINVQI